MFRKWECSCRSWYGASGTHTHLSIQCFGIPAPSVSSKNRILQSGIAEGMHVH